MLTIKNYHKLCDKPIGRDGWKVLFSAEGDNHYEIKMVCTGKTSVTIYLERNPTKTSNGRVAYMFRNWNGEVTQFGITPDWILDMGNMLKALNRFVC
jgi:hypothetical protein